MPGKNVTLTTIAGQKQSKDKEKHSFTLLSAEKYNKHKHKIEQH